MKILKVIATYVLLLSTTSCYANSIIVNDVKDLNIILEQIQADKPDKQKTLIVFDIDDTLLESEHFVGSDKWYNWQKGRATFSPQGDPISIAPKQQYGCISRLLSTFFELGSTHLTQPDVPEIIEKLRPYDLMLLTARTTSYRIPTERELNRYGLNFENEHLLGTNKGILFDLKDERRTAKVTYQNGVVLSSGLNKGIVLKAVLNAANREYDYIYFIDDSRKNIENMHNAWKSETTEVKNFHYVKVDKSVSQSEIKASDAIKIKLDEFISYAYPKRSEAFAKQNCD